ncbi:DUF420 domain-containing protein [Aequorivita marina]|uniref:DUF420 domain-containing protein n=1 Tax=Aequorivita marina TaxID=3073654 RepID=UPI002877231D|nr:DUF420 domain-containing protein [Aequorivita sp. S2608]MDS1299177.1 DUF420 domain-containing protein [Aequorivita sp. S2608]
MNFTVLIMTAVLLLTLFSPFGIYYGVSLAKKKEYKTHRKIQNTIFLICVLGVLALEVLIRYSGGSGSLASKSDYHGSSFFTITLVSHIIVAVLTYLLWTILIILSNRKFQKNLPGKFSKTHKRLAYIVFGGLIYTAITALVVYLMTLNLV